MVSILGIMRKLESYQSKKIVYAKDKNIKDGMQLTEDELKIQCIGEIFLQTWKNMIDFEKILEIAGYIDSCYTNLEPDWLSRI